MRILENLLLFLPIEALPLVIVVLGLGVISGLLPLRRAFGLILIVLVLTALGPVIDSLFVLLPWWVSGVAVLAFGLWAVRVVLESLFGREAAGHILGHSAMATFRGGFRMFWFLVALPARMLIGLIRRLAR